MRKQVNGKVVDIKNIELFESAAEGMAINRSATNGINQIDANIDYDMVADVVKTYKIYYEALPYPLYGLDCDIKYCAAGLFIKKFLPNYEKITHVNDGLWVIPQPFSNYGIHFVNNSWAIEKLNETRSDNCNIRNFQGSQGYEDFVWVLASLFSDSPTSKYYERFMPKFLEACNSQPMILKWELNNMLQFGYVPERIELQSNKVVDLNTSNEYIMDIFLAGYRATEEKSRVWSFNFEDGSGESIKNKQMPIFGFEAYEKTKLDNTSKPGSDKLKKVELHGLNSLFLTLCGIKHASNSNKFPKYSGIMVDNHFIYIVDGRLFITKSHVYTEAKEIGRGVEIYSYRYGVVYISKSQEIAPGITKEAIYSYDLERSSLRLCRIGFIKSRKK